MPKMQYSNQMVLKSSRVSARVDPKKRAWLEKQARKYGSYSAVINKLIEKEMEKNK